MTTQLYDLPHVVGIVGNDIISDTRVKRVAVSADAGGYKSTIVCLSPLEDDETLFMDNVEIRRMAIPKYDRQAYQQYQNPLHPLDGDELRRRQVNRKNRHIAILKIKSYELRKYNKKKTVLVPKKFGLFLYLSRISIFRFFSIARRKLLTYRMEFNKVSLRIKINLKKKLMNRFQKYEWIDFELYFGPVIQSLKPDLIHAHDVKMIGVAVNAARNLKAQGIEVKVVYDAHELIEGLDHLEEAVLRRWLQHEEKYIHEVDEIVCVSEPQSKRIQARYDLATPPKVVLNCPILDNRERETQTIRDQIGTSGKILVYHGKVSEARGIEILVKALEFFDEDIHIAILAQKGLPYIEHLVSLVEEIDIKFPGVSARLHILPYVPAEDLPNYLSTADVAVIPLLPTGNHNVAMPNKLFEAMQAQLPILSSGREALAAYIQEKKIGAVYNEDDPRKLAEMAHSLLLELDQVKRRYNDTLMFESSWASQAGKLIDTYKSLVPSLGTPVKQILPSSIEIDLT